MLKSSDICRGVRHFLKHAKVAVFCGNSALNGSGSFDSRRRERLSAMQIKLRRAMVENWLD